MNGTLPRLHYVTAGKPASAKAMTRLKRGDGKKALLRYAMAAKQGYGGTQGYTEETPA